MLRISLLLPLAGLILFGCAASKPELGVHSGRLAPCPDSPNCVSTQSPDEGHAIAPITYTGSQKQAMERLLAVINGFPRVEIVKQTPDYVHAVFKSGVFRFKDDVEFYFDAANHTIHMRSASRLGYSDFGANRKRLEKIKADFAR